MTRDVKNIYVTCRKVTKISIEQSSGEYSIECLTMFYAWGFSWICSVPLAVVVMEDEAKLSGKFEFSKNLYNQIDSFP